MEFITSPLPVDYDTAVKNMEERVAAIRRNESPETVWFLEHPALYTAGTSAKKADLLNPRFPVHETGRGGQYTYHGPGQRIAYVMADLQERGGDIRKYVANLEEVLIQTLAAFKIRGERLENKIGIWVAGRDGIHEKIAAIGVRVRSGVTYHGVSLNINPDLSHYDGIVPCGLREGVTSFHALGKKISAAEVDAIMQRKFKEIFNA
jgi:lipoyl(octanoyl) transferase